LGILFGTIALDLVGFGMVVPLLPLYAERYGASARAIAWLLAIYSLMQFVFAPLWGRLSDRVGRRPVLLTSIAGNVVALVLFASAPSYVWLLAARLVAGVCTANIAVAHAYVADITAPHERARGMGLVGAAFALGFVLGPFFGGELSSSRWGAAAPAWVAAGLGALNWILAYVRLPESLTVRQPTARPAVSWWRQRLQVVVERPASRPLYALGFAQILGFALMEMALVLFVQRRLGFDAARCGRLFAFVGLVLSVVQGGLIGRLVPRLGEVRLIQVGLMSLTLGLCLIPATPQGAWPVLLGPMVLLAVGQGLLGPSLGGLLSRSMPADSQGAALGLLQSLSALARALGPYIAGLLYERGGENLPFWAGAGVLAAAGLVCVPKLTRLLPSAA
jgi:multidrug resistance protein